MRAILLAGGIGSRLRPITEKIPKCLVPIKGRPLLDIWLENLTLSGVGPFLINTHYLSDQVEDFVSDSKYLGDVKLVYESSLLGTAGTLRANSLFFSGQDGMLIHADNFCTANFIAFQKAHLSRPAECLMTMMTFRTDDPSSCGIVRVDDKGVVTDFYEKSEQSHGNLANGAIYILSAQLIKNITTQFSSAFDFSNDVIPHLVGHIFTFETTDLLVDIGTPENYKKISES